MTFMLPARPAATSLSRNFPEGCFIRLSPSKGERPAVLHSGKVRISRREMMRQACKPTPTGRRNSSKRRNPWTARRGGWPSTRSDHSSRRRSSVIGRSCDWLSTTTPRKPPRKPTAAKPAKLAVFALPWQSGRSDGRVAANLATTGFVSNARAAGCPSLPVIYPGHGDQDKVVATPAAREMTPPPSGTPDIADLQGCSDLDSQGFRRYRVRRRGRFAELGGLSRSG
jgi:hypothetical protein